MKNKIREGFIFTTLAQFSNVASVLIVNIILSRMLPPSDFGIITLVQVFATFINLFTGEAVPSALIQNKTFARRDYSILLNYSIIFGIFFTFLFCLFGYALAAILNNEIYIPVSYVLSILVFTSFLNCVPQGIFLKELHFQALSIRRILSAILGTIVGIIAAFLGAGIYAIALTLIVPAVFTLIFSMLYVRVPMIWDFSIQPLKKIWFYLLEQTKFSILNYGYRNVDNVLIGQTLGSTALGFYSKSYQLLSQPITLFLGIVTPVLQPVLSNFQDDVSYIKNFYFKLSRTVSFITIPLSVFLSLNSKEIIGLLFGGQWGGAVLPMSFLSMSLWVQLLTQLITPIWQSRNLPKLQTRNGYISFLLILCCIIIGVTTRSISGVAFAVTISYYLNFLLSTRMVLKLGLHENFHSFFRILLSPILLGIICLTVLVIISPITSNQSNIVVILLRGLITLIVCITYLILTGNLKDVAATFL